MALQKTNFCMDSFAWGRALALYPTDPPSAWNAVSLDHSPQYIEQMLHSKVKIKAEARNRDCSCNST
jgi:hypothetical protein